MKQPDNRPTIEEARARRDAAITTALRYYYTATATQRLQRDAAIKEANKQFRKDMR